MKTYLVKQKFRFGGEKFDIKDDRGNVDYQVEGSFLKIPKTFTVYDYKGELVSQISKKHLQFYLNLRFNYAMVRMFIFVKNLPFYEINMNLTT